MARWLRNVGDFLEKLDTGDEVEDDVLAARDFAKELKEQTLDEDNEEQAVREDKATDPILGVPKEHMYAGGETIEANQTKLATTESENSPSDFQTPPRTANGLEEDTSPTTSTTNLKQYQTPAQFESELTTTASSVSGQASGELGEDGDHEPNQNPPTASAHSPLVQHEQPPLPAAIDEGRQQEVKLLKSRLQAMEKEKGEINQEARKLRKHMVTLNEQLEAADKELDAQRKELIQAAESLETNRKQSSAAIAEMKSKHAAFVKDMEQQHSAALVALKQQHVQQQDDLRQELLLMNNQNQEHTGSLGKRLEQLEDDNSKLTIERNDLLGQRRRLQAQYEDLSVTIDDLQNRTDQYSIKEMEYEDTMEKQRVQIEQLTKQRNRDVQALEEQLAALNMALASAKKTATIIPSSRETASNDGNDAGLAADCEYWKGEHAVLQALLEQEREQLNASRQDLLKLHDEKHTEVEELKRENAAVVVELRERIESLENQSMESKKSADIEYQHRNLSNQILRQQEQLSQANVEMAALRTRLSAALNRATVAEAAADDFREPIRLTAFPRRRKAQTVTLKQALGGGGQSVDFLDSFLAVTSKILRSNPYARLGFVLYLAILHLWTFALLVFHAHASTSAIDPSHGPQSLLQASLRKNGT